MKNNFKEKTAFTLAEVLITLGIIGIVSAMTIPTLINNYQKKVLANQIKKSYSMLLQGFKRMMVDDMVNYFYQTSAMQAISSSQPYDAGNPSASFQQCVNDLAPESEQCAGFYSNLSKYFRISSIEKIPGYKYKSWRGFYWHENDYSRYYVVKFADGSFMINQFFRTRVYNNNGRIDEGYSSSFDIDVNGIAGPNEVGRDIFSFALPYKNENYLLFVGEGYDYEELKERCVSSSIRIDREFCGAYLKANNWVMDY